MIFKVSFLAMAAVSAIAVSAKNNSNSTLKHSPTLEESDSTIEEKEESDELWDLTKGYEEKKVKLERRLVDLHTLKKQESCISELRKNLQEKTKEIQMLNVTIKFLKDGRDDLFGEIREGLLARKELEMVRKLIKKMESKMGSNYGCSNKHLKDRLLMLQEQVLGFHSSEFDVAVENRIKGVKNVELEIYEMKRKNKELELEKRELAVKLVTSQAALTSLCNNSTERTIRGKIEWEISSLKSRNEELTKQVERLQDNKFNTVEELVYQRWLNACLKFEIQSSSTKPKLNTQKHPIEKSCQQLVRGESISSNTSSTDSEKASCSDITWSCSSSSERNSDLKPFSTKSGLVHRFSPSKQSDNNDITPCLASAESAAFVDSKEEEAVQEERVVDENGVSFPIRMIKCKEKREDEVHILVVFFIFCFILVACFLLLAVGVH